MNATSLRSLAGVLVLGLIATACRAQQPATADSMAGMDSSDHDAMAAAHEVMSRMGAMAADPHLRMTGTRRGTTADSARAVAVVAQMRAALAKYRDVYVALADGFRQFLPGVPQPIYHFTNYLYAFEEGFRFDPARPTSLLYKKNGDSYELVGAMYADRARATEDDLDARIPLSIAHWHEHVNWCIPPRGATARWRETRDGKPVFGPKSPIADAAACAAVGGRFLPRIFGWMVHVQAFASDDPAVIWSAGHDHAEH